MNVYLHIIAMALTTYIIRALPLTLLKKPIKSRFLRSFLHYVPVACLTSMTFPAILYSTDHILSGAAGLIAGIIFAYKNKNLIVVAAASCVAVFVAEQLLIIL